MAAGIETQGEYRIRRAVCEGKVRCVLAAQVVALRHYPFKIRA